MILHNILKEGIHLIVNAYQLYKKKQVVKVEICMDSPVDLDTKSCI